LQRFNKNYKFINSERRKFLKKLFKTMKKEKITIDELLEKDIMNDEVEVIYNNKKEEDEEN